MAILANNVRHQAGAKNKQTERKSKTQQQIEDVRHSMTERGDTRKRVAPMIKRLKDSSLTRLLALRPCPQGRAVMQARARCVSWTRRLMSASRACCHMNLQGNTQSLGAARALRQNQRRSQLRQSTTH